MSLCVTRFQLAPLSPPPARDLFNEEIPFFSFFWMSEKVQGEEVGIKAIVLTYLLDETLVHRFGQKTQGQFYKQIFEIFCNNEWIRLFAWDRTAWRVGHNVTPRERVFDLQQRLKQNAAELKIPPQQFEQVSPLDLAERARIIISCFIETASREVINYGNFDLVRLNFRVAILDTKLTRALNTTAKEAKKVFPKKREYEEWGAIFAPESMDVLMPKVQKRVRELQAAAQPQNPPPVAVPQPANQVPVPALVQPQNPPQNPAHRPTFLQFLWHYNYISGPVAGIALGAVYFATLNIAVVGIAAIGLVAAALLMSRVLR